MNEGRRIVSVFIAPESLFSEHQERPRWWVPFLILLATSAITAILPRILISSEVWIQAISENLRDNVALNPEYLKTMVEAMRTPVALFLLSILVVVGQSVVTFLSTLLLWTAFAVFGKKSTYKNVLFVVAYSGLIRAIGMIVVVALAVALQQLDISVSLNFLPFIQKGSFLYYLAGKLDLFALWRTIVAGFGFALVLQSRKSQSFILTVVCWLLLSLAFAAIPPGLSAVLYW